MFKKLVFILMSFCFLVTEISIAQILPGPMDTSSASFHKCKLDKDYIASRLVTDSLHEPVLSMIHPSAVPLAAIENCGNHFTIYYEDEILSHTDGYSDPVFGALRRDNLCKVIEYIESVFDFSKVTSGRIRIFVERSDLRFGNGIVAAPFFSIPSGLYPTVDGFAATYITTGTNLAPAAGYHGSLGVDFEVERTYTGTILPKLNDFSITAYCGEDLASEHLHLMAHILGFFTFVDVNSGGLYFTPGPFTSVDRSLHTTPNPATTATPFAPGNLYPFISVASPLVSFFPSGPATDRLFWVNGNQPPHNYGIERLEAGLAPPYLRYTDGNDYATQNRISPGDDQQFVSGFPWRGEFKREFTKGELSTFVNAIGYTFNSTYATVHTAEISNHTPYSGKMGSDAYNFIYTKPEAAEALPADFTITNNIGTSLTIDLTTDPDLMDADGDPLSIFPASLVNFRGCGTGGNNHNLLSVNPAGSEIIYTPRDDFYGRAQFGFNLWDGKEKGGFVLYTIDVLKGTRVSITPGDNLVLNGSFEDGSEVKTIGTLASEAINNTMGGPGLHRGRFCHHFGDSHPYDILKGFQGNIIINNTNDAGNCVWASQRAFGHLASTFPAPWFDRTGVYVDECVLPYPPAITEARYQAMGNPGLLMYLGEEVQHCKRYELSFYAQRTHKTGVAYPLKETINFGFTDDAHLAATTWAGSIKSAGLIYSPTATVPAEKEFKYGTWEKVNIRFTYCADDPSNVLYLDVHDLLKPPTLTIEELDPVPFVIDSVSLKEVTEPFSVKISVENTGSCSRKLIANKDEIATYGCSPGFYTWEEAGKGIIGTGKEISIEPMLTTTYIVTADDGCGHIAADTLTIEPCRCSPSRVFTTVSYTPLSGTLTSSLSPGVYHVTADLSIASSLDFTGVKMLIEPGVKITVDPNVKLTIDNSHLLVCPDTNKLWKGIELTGAANSAKIEVRNNSMIEDAEIAINALNPGTTGGGNIIDIQNAVFNRNLKSVNIENYSASTGDTIYPFVFKGSVYTSRNFDTGGAYPSVWPDPIGLKTIENNGVRAPYKIDRVYTKTDSAKNGMPLEAAIKIDHIGAKGATYYRINIGGTSGSTEEQHHWQSNLFDYTCTGILSNMSNLASYNNIFLNMERPKVPLPLGGTPYYWGRGIMAAGDNIGNHLFLATEYPAINGSPVNKFFDCRQGISAFGFHDASIRYCRMSSSQTMVNDKAESGIAAGGGHISTMTILSNTISNMTQGIRAGGVNTLAGGVFKVNLNVLKAINPDLLSGSSTGQAMYYGMIIGAGIFPSAGSSSVAEVSSNQITGASNGIKISNSGKVKLLVSNNDIILKDWGFTQHGIYVTNSDAVDVSMNRISTPSLGVNDHMRGVYVSFSTNVSVCSNTATNVNRGFDFNLWRAQPGTRWIGNTMTNNSKGFVLGSDIGDQGGVIDHSTGLTSYFGIIDKWNGFSSGGRNHTYVENKRDTRLSKLFVRNTISAENPTSNDGTLATPPTIYYGSSLISNPDASNCEGVLDMGPRPHSFGTIGGVILAATTGYDSTERPLEWMSQLALYEMGSYDPEWRDSSLVLDSFMTAATGSRFEWLTAIGMALDNGDVSTAQTLLGSPVSAMGVNTVSNTITITDYIAADAIVDNYVRYYDRYIRFLQGSMNGSDTGYIQDLATKCPALDGAIVFKARTLYEWLADTVMVYNDDSCMDRGNSLFKTTPFSPDFSSSAESIEHYTLYPNPNNGSFILKHNDAEDRNAIIKIYNAIGALVYQQNANFTKGKVEINLGQKAQGLYLVCIEDGNKKANCLRFAIK